ncbi:MAG: hypothetical protein ACR65R_05650 [Methylomicrobium sp.]
MKKFIPYKHLIPLLVLFTCGAFSTAKAATYHVRTDGNDTNCNGSADSSSGSAPNCAFLTVQKAVNIAQAGDNVVVHAGTYGGFKTARSGSAGNNITFTRNGTDTVTITGQIIVDHNYITLNGFTTSYSDSYEGGAAIRVGYSSRVNNIKVTNCHLSGNGSNTFPTVFYADDVIFDGNIMEGPQFFIGMVLNGQRYSITNNKFRNIKDVERVFNVAVSNSVWRGNEIYGLTWTGNASVHPDIWQTIQDGSTAKNNIIENNYIHDSPDVQVANTENTGTNVSDWTWRNNVFANAGTSYIHTGNFKYYNNTYYRVGASNQSTVFLYKDSFGDASGAEFKNNIYVLATNQGYFGTVSGAPSYTHDYNFVANTDFSSRSGFSEPHGVNGGNPQFNSVASNCTTSTCNFHIGSTSVAKDKGTALSGFSADMDGNTRTTPWDMGGYESGAAVAYVLNPPSNLRIP